MVKVVLFVSPRQVEIRCPINRTSSAVLTTFTYSSANWAMPSTVKVRVKAARNLPLQDRSPSPSSSSSSSPGPAGLLHGAGSYGTRDPYVTVSLGGHTQSIAQTEEEEMVRAAAAAGRGGTGHYAAKTRVCRRTLHPVWEEEFRFDVSDDALLQDQPLLFKVCDNDVSGQEESSIGLVYVDLNPLLTGQSYKDDPDAGGEGGGVGSIDGWFPLYDTLSGVRGELLLSVKLNFIGDVNPFRDSAAGVRLLPFSTLDPASDYTVQHVFGFCEELVVADDPEFDWNENFRKSKGNHEQRQTLLYLLDASVRRRMCKTVLERGGNAVLGYHQNFDVEGDSGIVARTYGTCVLLERKRPGSPSSSERPVSEHHMRSRSNHHQEMLQAMDRILDKGSLDRELTTSSRRLLLSDTPASVGALHRETTDEEDVQLLTLRDFDPTVRVRFGGMVTARSVKYLGNLATKLSDQETRDSWWTELRDEIRAHAKVLCCTHVIGYLEASTIHDDVAVLSITGTAATVRGLPNLTSPLHILNKWKASESQAADQSEQADAMSDALTEARGFSSKEQRRQERLARRMRKSAERRDESSANTEDPSTQHSSSKHETVQVFRPRRAKPCSSVHVPYSHRHAPFSNLKLVPCLCCGKKWVPEVILATVEVPDRLPIRGSGVFIQARVCRSRPKAVGETDALAVSEALPFLEYDLARQLMLKLKVLGRNAAFSLKTEVDVGRQLIVSTGKFGPKPHRNAS
jgi:uncharacterized coiled-coil protein SlyX